MHIFTCKCCLNPPHSNISQSILSLQFRGRNKIKSQLKHRIKRIYSGNLASLIKIGLNVYFQILKSIINLNMSLNYQLKALIGLCCSILVCCLYLHHGMRISYLAKPLRHQQDRTTAAKLINVIYACLVAC